MRRSLAIAFASFLAMLPAAIATADPVATVGRSNDPWNGRPEQDPRTLRQCEGAADWIGDLYFRPVSDAARAGAIQRLERTSVVALTDEQATDMLGMARQGREVLAARYLDARIGEQEAERREVYEQRRGSWSLADQQALDELKEIRSGPRLRNMRPYLVRGLAEARLSGAFSMLSCGSTLVVMHTSTGAMYTPPDRVPLVVLLDRAPDAAFVQWAVGDPARETSEAR